VASQGAFCFRYFARKVPRIATAEPTDKTHYKVLGTYKSEAEASCGAASLAAEAMPEIQELVARARWKRPPQLPPPSSSTRLGKPASHGCVRLSPENAAALFALVEKTGVENTQWY
jgi:hypothetical protein